MKGLSWLARLYILSTLLIGGGLSLWKWAELDIFDPWLALACVLAAGLQVPKIEGTTRRSSYNLSWIVYGFALVLMGVPQTMLVITFAHIVEWIWHRYAWYIQSFNIATFAIATFLYGQAYALVSRLPGPPDVVNTIALLAGLATFTFANHLMIGWVIKLARGQSLSESGVLGALTLMLDFGLLSLGAAAALLWHVNSFTIVLVIFLAYLLHSALKVPALQRQAEIEPKTGLYNARYFAERLEQELDRANRFDRPLTVVMADLDLFRALNNTYGHLAGDTVLKGVATVLQEMVKDYEVLARFGGEEFAILMPETTAEEALPRVEAMRAQIEGASFTISTSVEPIRITMSFGIAGRDGADISSEALIHSADLALYEAKERGRNRVRVHGQTHTLAKAIEPGLNGHGPILERPGYRAEAERVVPEIATNGSEPVLPAPRNNGKAARILSATRSTSLNQEQNNAGAPAPITKSYPMWLLDVYIMAVSGGALVLLLFLIQGRGQTLDWPGLLLFGVITLLAEALAIEIYVKDTTVSTSAAPLIAGALLFGPAGAAILGLLVAAAAWFKQRSALNRLIFNTSNHIIAGLLVSGLPRLLGMPFREWAQQPQVLSTVTAAWPELAQLSIAILSAAIIYVSTTGLVTVAMGLSSGRPLRSIWTERFRWLGPYYAALGAVAYALIFSYLSAGAYGVLVILVPLLMTRFSQKQYIDHTKALVSRLRKTNMALTKQAEEISLLNEELLSALAQATDLRDPYVVAHSKNVARYAALTAEELGLSSERIELVRKAGLLHDIGKLGVPEAILFKPARLTDEEYEIVKEHCNIGAELLQDFHVLYELIPLIRYHHEHFNGEGYPTGLIGEEIPLEARIISLADAVEAMASDRPYRQGSSPNEILAEVRRCAGSQFDPRVAEAFCRVIEKHGESVIVNSARDVEPRSLGFYSGPLPH